MRKPSQQYYPADWLKDPQVRMCSPATRGIWWDWLSSMMVQDVGQLSGTPEQLARIAGVTPNEARDALQELEKIGAADVQWVGQVTDSSAEVTVVSRRLSRACLERASARKRKRVQRAGGSCTVDGPDDVTEKSRPLSSSSSSVPSGDMEKTRKTSSSAATPPQEASDVVIWLHCSGKKPAKPNAYGAPLRVTDGDGGSQYGVRQAEFDELARCYPGVDLRVRLENLRAYLRDTPRKRRTYARMSSWLHDRVADWQNRGRGQPAGESRQSGLGLRRPAARQDFGDGAYNADADREEWLREKARDR